MKVTKISSIKDGRHKVEIFKVFPRKMVMIIEDTKILISIPKGKTWKNVELYPNKTIIVTKSENQLKYIKEIKYVNCSHGVKNDLRILIEKFNEDCDEIFNKMMRRNNVGN